jgi:membrane protease YdiL (CAAX protease family)
MRHLLKNQYFIGYSALYIVTLILMVAIEHFPVSQSIAILLIFGVFFSMIAYITSKSSVPLFTNKPPQKSEFLVLILILVYITLMLALGLEQIKMLLPYQFSEYSKAKELITTLYKLLVFVLIPFLAYKCLYKFNLREFGLVVKAKEFFTVKNFITLIVMALVIFLFQFFMGNGARPIREGLMTERQLLIGLPLLYILLIFNVGLVEEFFFRALLQSRLAAITKSETGGIILSGLFFGLAHAPGFYLRGGGTLDNLGQHPSLLMSVGYSIMVLSVGGFFLSIIWSKTKNLWLVIAIHAFMDLLPGLQEFVKIWGIN